MAKRLRDCLRAWLAQGFWYPLFVKLIDILNERLSLARRFSRWLSGSGDAPRGAPEFYQMVIALAGAVWLVNIDSPLHPSLSTIPARTGGIFVALFFITELFVFCLHWIFVATPKLHSHRRSLACFLFNIIEVAILFTILGILADCRISTTLLDSFWEHLGSTVKLETIRAQQSTMCRVFSGYEFAVGTTLLIIIVASLVGQIVRPEDENQDKPIY